MVATQNTEHTQKIRLSHRPGRPCLLPCSVPVSQRRPGDCRFDSVESLHPSFHSFVRPSVSLSAAHPFRLPLSSPLLRCHFYPSSTWLPSPDPLAWPCPAAPFSRFALPPPRRSPQRLPPRTTWSPCLATRNTTPVSAVFVSTTAALSRTT